MKIILFFAYLVLPLATLWLFCLFVALASVAGVNAILHDIVGILPYDYTNILIYSIILEIVISVTDKHVKEIRVGRLVVVYLGGLILGVAVGVVIWPLYYIFAHQWMKIGFFQLLGGCAIGSGVVGSLIDALWQVCSRNYKRA
jgi:hypothetical protein